MKGFKTIEEQVDLLESRGMIVDNDAAMILLRENYYTIVNGYKDPFLDKAAMQSSADDVYLAGTRFDWLYSLFRFDRELRQITFSYLIQAEAALKTATVYAFCDKNRGISDYLDETSFCEPKDILVPKAFKKSKVALHKGNLQRLMGVLKGKLDPGKPHRPFTEHYLQAYGEVPLWVLSNDLTFGNMSHFYQLMKRSEQNAVCKHLSETTFRGAKDKRVTPHDVLRAYDVLVHFRNLCANDERIYCARKDNDTYATMLQVLEVALPKTTVETMKGELRDLLEKYRKQLRVVTISDLQIQLGLD